MQQYVIGTAGHVDHGKTVLIGALTGEETDRLPEEKKRGISIDLGFAEFRLPSGKRAGVIDVPGHERFIKNMVAGVTGIDLVILVVAADEGVMPQTREHLDILQLLGVQRGIVALTKIDLVEHDWLELVQEDLAETLMGTFLEGSPIIPVAAPRGTGLDRFVQTVDRELDKVPQRDPTGFARLPIDRAFTVSGFGTVITGTLVSGTVSLEDRLAVLPLEQEVRVRGLQVHGESVEQAYAGQRVAVNLSGVDVEDLRRGMVLLTPGSLRPTMSFAATVQMLSHSEHLLTNNERVRLHTGTSEILGRVLLLDRSELQPGEQTYMQFKAEQPVVVGRGDRYIIRTYSPMRTIAGGEILDPRRRFRRFNEEHLEELAVRDEGDIEDLVLLQLERLEPGPATLELLSDRLSLPRSNLTPALERLVDGGEAVRVADNLFVSHGGEERIAAELQRRVKNYHERYPLRLGVPREELRQGVMPSCDARDFQSLLDHYVRQGIFCLHRELVGLAGHKPSLTPEQQRHADALLAALEAKPFSPPDPNEFLSLRGVDEHTQRELLALLRERGVIVRATEGVYLAASAVNDILSRLRQWFASNETITVSELRDLLGTSRKYALPVLEYFDQQRITQRVGDKRVLRGSSQPESIDS